MLKHLENICAENHEKIKALFQQEDAKESENLTKMFAAFDADLDGQIDGKKDLAGIFLNMDVNQDDKINRKEFQNHFETLFYNLEFEFALENPQTWENSKELDLLKQLFLNSTIEESEVGKFL